jgi:hypothetical protein
MRGITAEQREKAAHMYSEGASVNKVANELKIGWITAKALQPDGNDDEDTEQALAWDLNLQIPEDRADDIFSAFTVQEKMDAIQFTLQGRMDDILKPGA